MSSAYVILFFLIAAVAAGDVNRIENSRDSRFISLKSFPNDISIGLDFSIPFIKIPLKDTFNFGSGQGLGLPKLDVNPTSLAFGGVLVLATSILASVFNAKSFPPYQNGHRYSRTNDGEFMTSAILDIAKTLTSNSHSCPSRLACWASRYSNRENLEIWQQMISNPLLGTILNSTAVEEAFRAGRNGVDCESFAPCPFDEGQRAKLAEFVMFHKA